MKDKASYYAIIPANVRYCKKITPNAKLLYGEIGALCNKEGFCWAANPYFAKLYNVNTNAISNWISSLERNNFIECRRVSGERRKIYIREVSSRRRRYLYEKEEGSPPEGGGVLNNTLNIKKNNGQTRFDHTWAVKLTNLIEKRGVIKGRIRLHQWETQLRRLRQRDGIKKTRIREVLRWFLKNSYEKYVPKIYHSHDLREKFGRIEAAMKRREGDNGELEGCRLIKTVRKGKITTSGVSYTNADN